MRNFLIVVFLLLLVAVALLGPSWLRFQEAQGVVPPGVRLAGLDIDGPNEDDVTVALNRLFEEPVAIFYADQRIILRPQMVGFQIDVAGMLADAHAYATPLQELRVFLSQVIGHPVAPADVPLRYTVDSDSLDNWLADVASRFDQPPLPPQPMLDTLTLAPGQPGTQLDLAESRARVLAALTNPSARSANLMLQEAPAPAVDFKALTELLQERLDKFSGIASLFLHDTTTGEEITINADVAYAGMSTMKIAILEELFRKLDAPPDAETTRLITETTSLSGNYTANQLLGIVGDGDVTNGTGVLNNSLSLLGLKNTFMAVPYDSDLTAAPHIVTEANSRTDLNTQPDPYIQTTPRDMALMLEMIVECSRGGGTLLAAYPGQLTEAECKQALDFLSLNEVHEMITAGVPQGTRVIHKHGYAADTHGDVAAIWGPAGPYVLSIYLYQPPWLEWAISNPTMQDLSKAVWNFYVMRSKGQ